MKEKIPSVLVSVCSPAKELLPMWIWIISDVSWLQTDSWKWKILRCERLAVGINASKVAVNVKHQSPEYRPSEIFRPLVSKVANWHPRSCNATVSKKKEKKKRSWILLVSFFIAPSRDPSESAKQSLLPFSHMNTAAPPGNPVALALTEVCVSHIAARRRDG